MMTFIKRLTLLVLSILALTSCARQLSSDVYSARQVGQISMTYPGVIRDIRQVCVNQQDQLECNELGLIGGGVAGGMIGNAVGRGNLFPTAVGAVAGAVTGSLIEKNLNQQMALEYIVEMQDGGLISVVQGPQNALTIGEPVYVIVSPLGRSRITPQYHY